jgi:hypothetical protein
VKGTVFGGILHFPEHPDADMHGLVRCCIRTANKFQIAHHWKAYGKKFYPTREFMSALDDGGTWQESQSHAEHVATETHYGELLVCPIVKAYLRPEEYRPVPKHLLVGKTETA